MVEWKKLRCFTAATAQAPLRLRWWRRSWGISSLPCTAAKQLYKKSVSDKLTVFYNKKYNLFNESCVWWAVLTYKVANRLISEKWIRLNPQFQQSEPLGMLFVLRTVFRTLKRILSNIFSKLLLTRMKYLIIIYSWAITEQSNIHSRLHVPSNGSVSWKAQRVTKWPDMYNPKGVICPEG